MNQFQMIEQVVNILNDVRVSGFENMKKILVCQEILADLALYLGSNTREREENKEE